MMAEAAYSETAMPPCPICGGRRYGPGPLSRMARNGVPPCCTSCGSLERHRILRSIYDALPDDMIGGSTVLQFSRDQAAPLERFGDVETSIFGGQNALDIMAIDRPSDRYDWVIANHVIEHVEDDIRALKEMLRVAKPQGIVQITAPTPSTRLATADWGFADPQAYMHWRGYGSDLPYRLGPATAGASGVQAIGFDAVTGRWDVAYFFSRSREPIDRLFQALRPTFPVLAATPMPERDP